MNKRLIVTSSEDLAYRIADICRSASKAIKKIRPLFGDDDPLDVFKTLRFKEAGCDPLDPNRDLNLIEQLTQTFTYLATFRAAERLFETHGPNLRLTLNLGTQSGADIETDAGGGIAAEVFAAVKPGNNNKLKKDLKKVSQTRANHKYVFFACPGYQPGEQDEDSDYPGVKIISLGIDFQENPTSGH